MTFPRIYLGSPRWIRPAAVYGGVAVCAVLYGAFTVKEALPYLHHTESRDRDSGVVITPASFDFGSVHQAEVMTHAFALSNRSRRAIRLIHVNSSCSCTVPPLSLQGRVLQPGDTCELPVAFRTGGRDGPISGIVGIVFQDAEHSGDSASETSSGGQRSVIVRAEVVPDFRLVPSGIDFGRIDEKSVATRYVRLEPKALTDLCIKAVRVSGRLFEAGERVMDTKTGVITVPITLKAAGSGRPQGPVRELLEVTTNSRRVPEVRIALTATFQAAIIVEPPTLVFLSGQNGDGNRSTAWSQRQVRLSAESPFKVREHKVAESPFQIAIDDKGLSLSHTITVRPKATSTVKGLPSLRMECALGKNQVLKVLEIPVYVVPLDSTK
jgi:hypothetical protein